MRDILISLKPYYYYLIGENIKKVEVRKSYPKAQDWSKRAWFYMSRDEKSFAKIPKSFQEKYRKHFGKVGMRFVCNKISHLCVSIDPIDCSVYFPDGFDHTEGTCLTKEGLARYLCGGSWSGKGYGLNITDLVVYDKPRELGEFFKIGHSEYRKSEWEKRKELEIRIAEYRRITKTNAHLNTEADFEANLKTLSPFKIKRPPQSWCYIESPQTAD